MIPKKYTSYEEIDRDLKVLRLQKEIDREHLKLSAQRIKRGFYPTELLGGVGGVLRKFMVSVVVGKLLKKLG
ncbi:DUF6327 family protein [Pseudozobellia thermophila]|uniref:Glutaminyl-tRNA synthetase n=1 Tax=Pseudozobellia thermophila TaxID=192903 RepID=A0A1M6BIH1_9FLAO|nr:DUF6327 family protein [Pseudozobellia thermophila]SHI48511.1 hypothetical protein SAMN04488513_101438 [Pseudozobellia thermophila]